MIFIVVKFPVKPEHTEHFMERVKHYTESTRAEEGNLWFDWSRSVEDPNEFVLVEAFRDGAGEAHVDSEHFTSGLEAIRPLLAATPKIISRQIEGEGWDEMGELQIG